MLRDPIREQIERLRDETDQPRFNNAESNAGLVLSRGLPRWESDPTRRGEALAAHIRSVTQIPTSPIYRKAYERWRAHILGAPHFASWIAVIDGRLFTGLGSPNVLETQITLNRTYGVPYIPGSSIKGAVRSRALERHNLADEVIKVLFGVGGESPDENDAGYLIFHDAWWVPASAPTALPDGDTAYREERQRPLTAEVVTVHHAEYYQSSGATAASDFDSPNPSAQIAAHGAFLFVIEGAQAWAEFGMRLLEEAATDSGFGAKTRAGYGYFREDSEFTDELGRIRQRQARREALAGDPVQLYLEELFNEKGYDGIALAFSRNKTRRELEERDPPVSFDALLEEVRKRHGEEINSWEKSPKENRRKAYRKIFPSSSE